jgi:hypothetical protein
VLERLGRVGGGGAGGGGAAGSGIYDLSFDWDAPADRSWTLLRAMD